MFLAEMPLASHLTEYMTVWIMLRLSHLSQYFLIVKETNSEQIGDKKAITL